jgi:hypothetical protein
VRWLVIWLLVGGLCLVVATVYTVVWPRPLRGIHRPVWQHLLLRWGHALVWLLLAGSFALRAAGQEGEANLLALAGGLLYVLFIAGTVVDRQR